MAGTSIDRPARHPALKRRIGVDAAALEAERRLAAQRQRRNRSLVRHGLAFLLVVAVATAVYGFREEGDPAHPEAMALAARFDEVFAAVATGELELSTTARTVAPGVSAASVTVGERVLGVATGAAGGECYAFWWDAELVRHSRVLAEGIPCTPATIVTSIRPIHFDRLGPVEEDPGPYAWDRIVPSPVRQRLWFLPVMAVLGGVALALVTRIVTTAITGRTPAELARDERHRKS